MHQPHDAHIYKAFSHSSNPGGVTYATDEMQVTTGSNSVPIFLSIELYETFKRVRHLIILSSDCLDKHFPKHLEVTLKYPATGTKKLTPTKTL